MRNSNRWLFWGGVFTSLSLPINGWGAGELYLNFHTAGSSAESSFVRVSLINRGDESIAYGYLVVTLLDTQCQPQKSILKSFDEILPGHEKNIRVPIDGRLQRYRLGSIAGYDRRGIDVSVVDGGALIFKVREPEERAHCAQARRTMQRETVRQDSLLNKLGA